MINKTQLNNLATELFDVCAAILDDETVWMRDPVDGWVITKLVNPHKPRADYHIGEVALQ